MAHGEIYNEEFGRDADFEALVARIVADYAADRDAAREAAWIVEADASGESLGPELQAWLIAGPPFGMALRHPLVYLVPYRPHMAARANAQLRWKMAAAAEALWDENWHRFVWLHERPGRPQALSEIAAQMAHEDYWRLLASVWADTELLHDWGDLIERLMSAARPGRFHLMTDEERDHLGRLPDPLTLHRGFRLSSAQMGWSWPTDPERAAWFARRSGDDGTPRVVTALVARLDVIAYFTGRSDNEVVIDPACVEEGSKLSMQVVPDLRLGP